MDMLAIAISLLDRPAELAGELEQLGAAHVQYGTRPEHYSAVRAALLEMLAEVNGNSFSPQARDAWNKLYDFIEAAMLRGASRSTETAGKPTSMGTKAM